MRTAKAPFIGADVESQYRVTLYDDLKAPEIRQLWARFQDSQAATAFQQLPFVEELISHLRERDGISPIIVAVHDRDRGPVLLTALVRRQRFGATIVENLDFELCDYTVPLTAPGRTFGVSEMSAIMDTICGAVMPCDAVIIKKVCGAVQGHTNPFALLPDATPMNASCATLNLSQPACSKNGRRRTPTAFRDAAKKLRKLSQIGPVSFEQATTPEDLSQAIETMIAQRADRFAALHRFDILRDPQIASFYRDLAYRGLADGSVRVFSLKIGDELLAVVYALEHQNTLSILIPSMAVDEMWKAYSPGLIALVKATEWARIHGMELCDLGVGGLGFKSRLGTAKHQLYEIHRPLSLRGRLAVGEAKLRQSYRAFGQRFPAIDTRLRQTLRK